MMDDGWINLSTIDGLMDDDEWMDGWMKQWMD